MNRIFFPSIIVVIALCLSCVRIPANEHTCLSFENNSHYYISTAIETWQLNLWNYYDYLTGEYPYDNLAENQVCIRPHETNYRVLPLKRKSYEQLFTKTDRITIFVFPRYYSKDEYSALHWPSWDDLMIASYELTLDELIELNFHLVYPPDERMRDIKMWPEYSSFEGHSSTIWPR